MGYCMYLGPMHLAGFATQNISCSCWATGLVLWYLSQVWVVINTARPKKCMSIVMTLSTQRAAILMRSRKNIVLWTLTPPGFAFRIHVTNTKYLLPWPPRTHRTGHPWVPNTSPQTELRMSISWRVLSFIEYTYIEYIYIYTVYIYTVSYSIPLYIYTCIEDSIHVQFRISNWYYLIVPFLSFPLSDLSASDILCEITTAALLLRVFQVSKVPRHRR